MDTEVTLVNCLRGRSVVSSNKPQRLRKKFRVLERLQAPWRSDPCNDSKTTNEVIES